MIASLLICLWLFFLGGLLMVPVGLALNVVGLPGALLALNWPRLADVRWHRFIPGLLLSAGAQSFVYVSYVAFVVKSIHRTMEGEPDLAWLIWTAGFFAAIHPINVVKTMGFREDDQNRREALATGEELAPNANVWGAGLTFHASIVSFLWFANQPSAMATLWGWVPSIRFG